MPVKKPSAKATKAKKTVSAKAAAKPAAKAAAKPAPKAAAKAAPRPKAAAAKPAAKPVRKPTPARPEPAAGKRPTPAPKVVEAAEALGTGASLLAGPRNVQPYVARKGEEYMSKEQLEHFRRILSLWKQDLMQEVTARCST